ncbi:MAG TPA: hypothetical protein VMT55_03985, partial [Candidatus Sulfotelmatobacter sp.]|nr:hypothetical protein [Candidatus Sulfotelmatobacter sp.]
YKAYLTGFNQGYILTEHLPQVAEKLATIQSKENEPWISGIRDGREQYFADQVRGFRPKWLDQERGPAPDTGPAKDLGKEDR